MKLYLAFGGLLAVAVLTTASLFDFGREKPQSDPGPGTSGRVVLSGVVAPENGIVLPYPVQPGRIREVRVREDEHVSAGSVLLCLDDEHARLQLKQAEADLEAAEANLQQALQLPEQHRRKIAQQQAAVEAAEAKLKAAEHGLKRQQELADLKLLNPEEVESTRDQVKALQAALRAEREKAKELDLLDPGLQVRQARAAVAAKQAQLDLAREQLEQQCLRAPADGVVLRVTVRAGDVLSREPTEAPILFAPDEPRVVRISVEQEFAARVGVGDRARIEDPFRPGASWQGRVSRVGTVYLHERTLLPQRFPFSLEKRTLECIVTIESDSSGLRIGQEVRVTILPNESAAD